jgi:hypothetical protein
MNELNTLFGEGELVRIVFRHRSTQLKRMRRQRIRTMAKLSQLADTHALNELRDPATAAHAEMVNLVDSLAKRNAS